MIDGQREEFQKVETTLSGLKMQFDQGTVFKQKVIYIGALEERDISTDQRHPPAHYYVISLTK